MERMPLWKVVLQSQTIHPEWTAEEHQSFIDSEAWWIGPEEVPSLDTIERWMRENVNSGVVAALRAVHPEA